MGCDWAREWLRGRCARLSRVSGFYDPASVLICVAVRLCRLPDCRDGPPLSPTLSILPWLLARSELVVVMCHSTLSLRR